MALNLTVHLVRHGQSEWNVARIVQGQTAHPALTELGRRQADATAAALSAIAVAAPIDRLLTSDLVRAVQTAEPIAAALGRPAELEPRLREQAMGELEGLTSAAALEQIAGAPWSDDVAFGGARGESHSDVARRVGALLRELIEDPATRAAVLVTHGDAIRVGCAWLAATAPGEDFGWAATSFTNGSITTARLQDGVLHELRTWTRGGPQRTDPDPSGSVV